MKNLILFLSLCSVFFLILLLSFSRFFSFYGIVPNLSLIFFVFVIFSNIPRIVMFFLLALFFVFSFFISPFFVNSFLALIFSVLIIYFLKRILTGNKIIDLIICIICGTLIFSVLVSIFENISSFGLLFSYFSISLGKYVLLELIYNLFVSLIIYLLFKKILSYE